MNYATKFAASVVTALTLLSAVLTAQSMQPQTGLTLTVQVTGTRNANGKIRAALFSSAQGFPKDTARALQTQLGEIDPATRTANILFTNLKAGEYAIVLYHDENMNGKLDTNFMGIPKEGFASSNNPKPRLGPPDYNESKFQLTHNGQTLQIKLLY